MDFSIPQKKAIDIRNTNVVVSASAGSGKTAVLVERLCQLVLKDHISIDSILAMTFTKDAASEMKARLLSKLKAQPKTDYILQQMALLETASISTIDSFCLSIVQNYYYKIPISYTMSKQTASSAQTRISFENAYKHAIQDLDLNSYTKLKMYFHSFGKTEEDIQKYIEDILAIINSKSEEDAKAWMENIQESYTYLNPKIMEYALKYFHNHCLAMTEILDEVIDQISKPEDYEIKREYLSKCLNTTSYSDFKSQFELYLKNTIGFKKTIDKVDYSKYQTSFKEHETRIVENLFDEAFYLKDIKNHKNLVDTLFELTNKVKLYFQLEKKKMEVIDFNDMEHFAYQLLQDPMIKEEMYNKYQMILVDEFQDTNELQEKIIASFCHENNVFRVGDIKQSIYGFRQANPKIMQAWMEKEDDNNTPLLLQENYRSNASVIQFNNDFYSKIMNNELLGEQFKDIDIANVGTKGQMESPQYPVRFLYTEYKDEEGNKATIKKNHNENRFDLIAQDIIEKHNAGMPYKSMCVLTRNHAPQEKLKAVFEAYNIPAMITIDHGFFTNPAIQIVISTLKALEDLTDDISLCASLMSPLFNVSFSQIAKCCIDKEKGTSLYMSIKNEDFMKPFFELYANKNKTITQLLQYIYAYNNFYYASTTIQDKNNLDYLLELAGQFENQNDIHSFVLQLSKDAMQDQTQEASLYGKEDDVVQVKTMHQSKGLQFPVVYILSQHEQRDKHGSSCILLDSTLGLSLKGLSLDYKLKYNSIYHLALQTKKELDDLAEEMRVFYVATTRPQKELVIVDTIESIEDFYSPLNAYTLLEDESYTGWLLHTYANTSDSLVVFDKKSGLYERPLKVRQNNTPYALPAYSKESKAFSSQTASGAKIKLDWKEVSLSKNMGAIRGTLFHEIVAHCAYPYQEKEILSYANSYGYTLKDHDIKQILALNEDSLYSSWMKEKHVFEQSYIIEEKNQVVHGFMDLVIYKEDEVIIVDFKTDAVDNEQKLIDLYTIQLQAYKKAMKKLTNLPINTYIYSFSLSKCIYLE
ncbi:UvrD-helicase domain-containing protein [Holdemanella biformis]|uniref:UvrD-helicase domain-containing protein n=1 Tax=Holdemanella biformis TaxID=1735 RepID=UPI001D149601|nr:UvrD-helicase domain-containing protein [Holdemanella biformis]MCC3354373.1 UvrD-helicase domain-containing protein [Holdemanella biformis]